MKAKLAAQHGTPLATLPYAPYGVTCTFKQLEPVQKPSIAHGCYSYLPAILGMLTQPYKKEKSSSTKACQKAAQPSC